MAIRFIASAIASNSTVTPLNNITVSKPTGTIEHDVMVAMTGTSIGTAMTSTGWTQIGSTLTAGTDVDTKAWFKVAGAAEAASYSWTQNTTDNQAVGIATFRGVDIANPMNIQAGDTTNTTQNVTGPSATSTARGLALYCRYVRDDAGTAQTIASNASKPTGFQVEMHISGVNIALGMFYESGETNAGVQSGQQLNYSITGPVGQISRTIVLKSARIGTTNINQAVKRGAFV